MKNLGFTLIELLVVIGVLIVIGTVSAQIVTSSLRGTNKTNLIESIRQNGNYTISQMGKTIEYAQVFEGLSNDNINYINNCPYSTEPTPSPVFTSYRFIKVKPVNGNSVIYECRPSIGFDPATISLNGASIIDTNAVSVSDCSIACIQSKVTDTPVIKIKFDLSPKDSASTLLEKYLPPITFETSITMRNYIRQ